MSAYINKNLTRVGFLLLSIFLFGCEPSEKQRAEFAEQKRIECLGQPCEGDLTPKHEPETEVVQKVNGEYLIAPRKYFGGASRGGFVWWERKPISGNIPPEVKALARKGESDEFSIDFTFYSPHLPRDAQGYRFIELAQKNGWIAERKTIRNGLDMVTMKHVIDPNENYVDRFTYYVATNLIGNDAFPPVARCDHSRPENSGNSGVELWTGIAVGIKFNQKHCADWPEIYQESIRILNLIRKV